MSCAAYGCVAYNAAHDCQCNIDCETSHTCCSDFVSQCEGIQGFESAEENALMRSKKNSYSWFTIGLSIFALFILGVLIILAVVSQRLNERKKKQSHSNMNLDADTSTAADMPYTRTNQRLTHFFTHKAVLIPTYIALVFYVLSMVCYVMSSFATQSESFLESQLAAVVCWCMAYGAVYMILLARLYFLYSNRYTYANKRKSNLKCVFAVVVSLGTIVDISMFVFIIEFASDVWDNNLLFVCIVVGFVAHIAFCILCLLLFIKKLFELTFDRASSLLKVEEPKSDDNHNSNAMDDNDNGQPHAQKNAIEMESDTDTNLTAEQTQLIEVVIRLSVLYSVSILSSVVLLVVWGVFFAIEDKYEGRSDEIPSVTFNIAWWLFPVDVFINFSCILLNLAFTTKIYRLLCCCVHLGYTRVCMGFVNSILRIKDGNVSAVSANFEINTADNDML